MCLAQGQQRSDAGEALEVRLEPTAPRSRVKHSTTEPLRSLDGYLTVSYVHIHGCQKNWANHVPKSEIRAIHIPFFKRGFIIYLATLKMAAIRYAHAYYVT